MTGRLNDVLAELSVLGAVRMEQLPPRRPAPPPEPAPEPAVAPAPEPPSPPQADEDIPPVDDDVEAKIRALSNGYAAEPDDLPEDPEVPDQTFPDRTFPEPPVKEAVEDDAPPVEDEPPLRRRDTPKTARRLREAFARLDLLEACAADLREALEAVAKTMEER